MSVKELFSWDLACFRLPTHPEMRKMVENSEGSGAASKILETIGKKYIVLKFATPAGQYILHTWTKELLTTCREGIILRGVLQT